MSTATQPQVVLVTGTSSGIGRATVDVLAEAGHTVVATMRDSAGRNAGAAAGIRDHASQRGLAVEVADLDVTDEAQAQRAVDAALERHGRLDVVVNNAGTGNVGVLEGYTLDQVRHLFEVNTFGPLILDRAVLPAMRAAGRGLLVHVSSTAGRIAVPFVAPYSAAKAALEMIAEELAGQLAPFGVESVLVEPGSFATPAFGKLVAPADTERLAGYGEMATKPAEMFAGMTAAFDDPQVRGLVDPRIVGEVVRDLVAMPAGTRPLRSVAGEVTTAGVAELNEASAAAKQKLLTSLAG